MTGYPSNLCTLIKIDVNMKCEMGGYTIFNLSICVGAQELSDSDSLDSLNVCAFILLLM